MDSSVSLKDQIWFLRVCHHVSNELYLKNVLYWPEDELLRSKHVVVMWPDCVYFITVIVYRCALTVCNTLVILRVPRGVGLENSNKLCARRCSCLFFFLSYERSLQLASAASNCYEVSDAVVLLNHRTFALTRILVSNFCPEFGVSRAAWGGCVDLKVSKGWPM